MVIKDCTFIRDLRVLLYSTDLSGTDSSIAIRQVTKIKENC